MVDAYILIQTEIGTADTVTASVWHVPGICEAASVAGPYDVVARARSDDLDQLAKLVSSQIQPIKGVRRAMSCPIVRL